MMAVRMELKEEFGTSSRAADNRLYFLLASECEVFHISFE
jgi:hypothetical protein